MLSSYPVLSTKSFLKPILHSNESGGMKFQFRFAWNITPSPAFVPMDQRRSAGTTFSDSDDGFLQLPRSYSAMCTRSSQLQRWDGVQKETFRVPISKGIIIMGAHTCLNGKNVLVCHSLCCRTSCVGVQPCTPRVLPNTERFLPPCVFSVTCVAPALGQIVTVLAVDLF